MLYRSQDQRLSGFIRRVQILEQEVDNALREVESASSSDTTNNVCGDLSRCFSCCIRLTLGKKVVHYGAQLRYLGDPGQNAKRALR